MNFIDVVMDNRRFGTIFMYVLVGDALELFKAYGVTVSRFSPKVDAALQAEQSRLPINYREQLTGGLVWTLKNDDHELVAKCMFFFLALLRASCSQTRLPLEKAKTTRLIGASIRCSAEHAIDYTNSVD